MTVGWLLSTPAHAAPGEGLRPLDLEARIACQTAIEEVLWQHRIWPAENPMLKPQLAEVMPESAVRAKVETTLRQSNALAERWGSPITGEMLQAEIARMATSTRQPERLQDLWAALDNDPFLVAECLARPALAARLVEQWHAEDDVASFATELSLPEYAYHLPEVAPRSGGGADTWLDTPSMPLDNFGDVTGEALWTGSEMLYLRDHSTQGYRYQPATDTWQTMTTLNSPSDRREFTAVWTGTEMIVWGGCFPQNHRCTLATGASYDPATDIWTAIPEAPLTRTRHSAVWTGSEMLVWGGCIYQNFDTCSIHPQTGLRFDPDTNSWQTMTSANAPTGRDYPGMVWTGEEMIVWDGTEIPNSGGRYDPDTDTWQDMSTVNAPAPQQNTLIWTGSEVIAWGGCTFPIDRCDVLHDDGGRYVPATDSWTPISSSGAPSARVDHQAVWTGTEMIVWGGCTATTGFLCTTATQTGGRYDPATDNWAATATSGAPSARYNPVVVWSGEEMIVWGGEGAGNQRNGARYDPATNSWMPINDEDPDSLRYEHEAIWTGAEMIVWGGLGDGDVNGGLNTGRRYNPVIDQWSVMSLAGAPEGRFAHTMVWTGTEMIVWGGRAGTTSLDTGSRYNPMTDSWDPTSTVSVPEARNDHSAVWTGSEMIIWGGSTWSQPAVSTGARYNPSTNSWTALPAGGAPAARRFHTAVWAGDEMIIWGGYGLTGHLDSGGRYDPASNSWNATTTSGAPQARSSHTTVWTGDEMIVWGGTPNFSTGLNTGGRYDADTDTWNATTLDDAPSPRTNHTAVWTGEEMIVWGDNCSNPDCLPTGGRYDPGSDAWQATSLNNAPETRGQHTAVWTGSEMIIWGGIGVQNGIRNTGGRYIPSDGPPPAGSTLFLPLVSR